MFRLHKSLVMALAIMSFYMVLCAQAPGWGAIDYLQTDRHVASSYDFTVDQTGNLISYVRMSGYGFLNYPQEEPSYSSNSESWLWKQDPAGNTLWAKNLLPDQMTNWRIGTDMANNIYLTGTFYNSITLGSYTLTSSGSGRYAAKLNGDGEWLWAREINGIVGMGLYAFKVGKDGSCFFTGSASGNLNFDGMVLECSGYPYMVIARMNNEGSWVWARQASGDRTMSGNMIAPGVNGDCFVFGKAANMANFGEFSFDRANYFVAHYGPTGVCVKVQIFTNPINYPITSYTYVDLLRTQSGRVLLLYEYKKSGENASRSIIVRKCFPNSNDYPEVFYSSGYTGFASPTKFATDASNNIYLLGSYNGPYTLNNSNITLTADRGFILAKLNSQGQVVWATDPSPMSYLGYEQIKASNSGQIYLGINSTRSYPVGPFQTSPGSSEFCTVGVDTNGEFLWMRSTWNGHIGSNGKDVYQSPDGDVFLCGNYRGDFIRDGIHYPAYNRESNDVYVARKGQGNSWDWVRTAGGPDEGSVEAFWVDSDQNVFITGYFQSSMQCGDIELVSAGGKDIYVAKLDGAGNWLWAESFGSSGDDIGTDIVGDQDGNLYLCGSFSGTMEVGTETLTSQGASDGMVIKLNPQGMPLAVAVAGGAGNDQITGIAMNQDAKLVVCGSFEGSASFGAQQLQAAGESDILVGRLDQQLNWLHCWGAGGSGNETATDIGCDATGYIYVTGVFDSPMSFGSSHLDTQGENDIFIAKTDHLGNWQWGLSCGSTGADMASAIAVTHTGTVYITGHSRGDLHYGSSCFNNRGQQDILVASASSSGDWLWAFLNGPYRIHQECYGNTQLTGSGIALHDGGNCIVTGTWAGYQYFANTEYYVIGAYDTFVGALFDGVPISDPIIPAITGLSLSASPSPFREKTYLNLELPDKGEVCVKVYNLRGELVQTLFSGAMPKGSHQLHWNGADARNSPCASGIYLIKAKCGLQHKTLRVVKL